MLVKAAALDVDEVVIDFEDALPLAQKTDATRRAVGNVLCELDWRAPTVSVRVNGVGTPWFEADIDQLLRYAAPRIDCIVLPKVEHIDDIAAADRLLEDLETELALRLPIGLEAVIESARGLSEVERIARSSERLECLIFGPADYVNSLGIWEVTIGGINESYPCDQWHYPRSRIAVAAHANGLDPIDGPFALVADEVALRESARRARQVGFVGKWAIHPAQITACNDIFGTTTAEVDRALRLLQAMDEAELVGRGATIFEGRMIDEASRRMAAAVVARSKFGVGDDG
jgi:citrate lyase subunit beta/citryl-CoA lyase